MLKPNSQVPVLNIPTVQGGEWSLTAQKPEHFTLVVFYRGYHCPICKSYLRELERKLEAFASLGVTVIALSSDSQERAEKTYAEWNLSKLTLGYGLSIASAREWGLFVSKGIKEGEPSEFSEPGMFVVRPDGRLYASAIQTMPFARPKFDELVGAMEYVIKHDYPARGDA